MSVEKVGAREVWNQSVFIRGLYTDNWGCGAFGGESRLKALIQLIAGVVWFGSVYYNINNIAIL